MIINKPVFVYRDGNAWINWHTDTPQYNTCDRGTMQVHTKVVESCVRMILFKWLARVIVVTFPCMYRMYPFSEGGWECKSCVLYAWMLIHH